MYGDAIAVVALGGNALAPEGQSASVYDQFRHTRESLGPIVDLALDSERQILYTLSAASTIQVRDGRLKVEGGRWEVGDRGGR